MHELTSDDEKRQIVKLYQAGESSSTIAALTGVPVHRVRLVLKNADLLERSGRRSGEDHVWPKIEALLDEGRPITEIAKLVDTPYQTVLRWCRKRGVDTSGSQKTMQLQKRAAELAKLRLSAEEIAEKLGVSTTTVTRWLRAQNLSSQGQKGRVPVKKMKYLDRVLELHSEGKTVYEIADIIGDVSFGSVVSWLQGENLRPHYGAKLFSDKPTSPSDPHPREDEAVQRYLAGEAATTIDKDLGVRQGSVETWARVKGVWEQGGKFKRRRDRGELAARLFEQGETLAGIAKALGTDFYSAKKILIEDGLLDESEGGPHPKCPCGEDAATVNSQYCTPEHRALYGGKRQPDPDKYVTFVCLNEKCPREGEPVTRYKKYGSGHSKYCSNDCARTHTKTKQHVIVEDSVVLDNGWEPLFWGLCKFLKVPVERLDRSDSIRWKTNGDGLYGPDFVIPMLDGLAVEVKGQEDPEDAQRWAAWRAQRGDLAVLLHDEMQRARLCNTRTELLNLLTDLAKQQG